MQVILCTGNVKVACGNSFPAFMILCSGTAQLNLRVDGHRPARVRDQQPMQLTIMTARQPAPLPPAPVAMPSCVNKVVKAHDEAAQQATGQ